MTYFESLIKDARLEADATAENYDNSADLLRDLAVALEVQVAENESLIRAHQKERDALRAQLDGMTTEWGVRAQWPNASDVFPHRDREECERFIAWQPLWYTHRAGETFSIVSRTAASRWVEVE